MYLVGRLVKTEQDEDDCDAAVTASDDDDDDNINKQSDSNCYVVATSVKCKLFLEFITTGHNQTFNNK